MNTEMIDLYAKTDHVPEIHNTTEGEISSKAVFTNYDLVKRLVRVAVLAVCYFVIELIAKALAVTQFLYVAWKKRPHPGMQRLGTLIAAYMRDLWRYCTFSSDRSPWPFRQ